MCVILDVVYWLLIDEIVSSLGVIERWYVHVSGVRSNTKILFSIFQFSNFPITNYSFLQANERNENK